MRKYIFPIFMVFIILISLNVLASSGGSAINAELSRCTDACRTPDNEITQVYVDCVNACGDAFDAAHKAHDEASRSTPSSGSAPSTSSGDTTDYDAEAAQRQADHEARMAEIQASIDASKARSAQLKAETAAIVAMREKLTNGEVEEEDVPCESLSDPRVKEMITKSKEDYASTGDDYVRNSALTSDDKLIVTKMVDGELKCNGYKEITPEERQRRQDEADAEKKRKQDEADEKKAKNDAIKAENALIGIEDDAYNEMRERIENKEMVRKEVACNGLTDSRVVGKINSVKSDHAADGQDVARVALTSDKKLYFVQIVDNEMYCYGYRGAGVVDAVPENREVRGKVKVEEGTVKILRDGIITPVGGGYEVRAGDTLKTDKEGIIGIVSKDGLVQLHGDTVVGFIGLEFDPVSNRRVISPPPDAPWVADPSSFKYPEVDNDAFWKALYDDLVNFHIENKPSFIVSCGKALMGDALALASCGVDTAAFVYSGKTWFEKKIEKDKAAGIVLTPTVAITTTGTKFSVEVADDGSTIVTTLEGNVIVTDLTSRKSVVVSTNEQILVPKSSTGLGEEKLKQSLATINPQSINTWWFEKENNLGKALQIFGIIFLVTIAVLGGITYTIKKYANKKTKAWGIGSLAVGILGILLFIISPVGLALSLGAIYFYILQKKIQPTGLATAGLILGIIGTILTSFFLSIVLLVA